METISTVGYGDIHPVTAGGRLVAASLMVLGIALIAMITATVVAWFSTELELLREFAEIEEATDMSAPRWSRCWPSWRRSGRGSTASNARATTSTLHSASASWTLRHLQMMRSPTK